MKKIELTKEMIRELKKLEKFVATDKSRINICDMVYLPKKRTIEGTNGKVLFIIQKAFYSESIDTDKTYTVNIVDSLHIVLTERPDNFPLTERIVPKTDNMKLLDNFIYKGSKEVKEMELSKIMHKLNVCINYTYLQKLPFSIYKVYIHNENFAGRPIKLATTLQLGEMTFVAMPISLWYFID